MKFGQKLKLKKEWIYNKYLTFTKDEILQVAQYEHKYGMKLHHPKIADLLDFQFNWMDRDIKIEEYFEVIEEFDDKSCNSCKYWGYKDDKTTIETCNFGLIEHSYNANSFYCNRYENKDK